MWEMIPGRYLKGLYSKKKYGSFDEAAAVCAKKGACKVGPNQEILVPDWLITSHVT